MKKRLAIILSVALSLSLLAFPTFAATDTTSGSSAADPAPAAPAQPAAPAPKAPAAPAAPAPAATSDATYTVVQGDAMWKIAQKHGMTLQELVALNPQIKNINLIFPGQKINVKKAADTASTVKPAEKLYLGTGLVANYRKATRLAFTTASVIFNEKGQIVDLELDVLEISNSDFPAWLDEENGDPEVNAKLVEADKDGFDWETKREKGPQNYNMLRNPNLSGKDYFEQLEYYEKFFTGKTVAEIKDWVDKYTYPYGHADWGRPFKAAYLDQLNDEQKAPILNLTEAEKKMLVDVTTNATMAIQDNHSRFVDAIEKAWNARKELKTSL